MPADGSTRIYLYFRLFDTEPFYDKASNQFLLVQYRLTKSVVDYLWRNAGNLSLIAVYSGFRKPPVTTVNASSGVSHLGDERSCLVDRLGASLHLWGCVVSSLSLSNVSHPL